MFQSTRPTWGATKRVPVYVRTNEVSIHAPHVGRDLPPASLASTHLLFQSTRPTWGATPDDQFVVDELDVSIHAPHVGRDAG